MESSLYIRVRGRVLGPYETDKLQSMVRRGQLSRMHELSTDGMSWVRASTYPELFTTNVELPQPTTAAVREVAEPASTATANGALSAAGSAGSVNVPTLSDSKWYYSRAGAQAGPIDAAMIRGMALNGQLSPDDLIWTDGMPDWQPARNVPGFTWSPASAASMYSSSQQIGSDGASSRVQSDVVLPDSLVRAAAGARGWVIFVSVVLFLLAGLSALGGVAAIVEGARNGRNTSVAGGIFSLLTAVVISVGAFMLIAYGSRLGGLRFSTATILLERALDSLRIFWLYVGICLIVWIVFLVVLVVFSAALVPI